MTGTQQFFNDVTTNKSGCPGDKDLHKFIRDRRPAVALPVGGSELAKIPKRQPLAWSAESGDSDTQNVAHQVLRCLLFRLPRLQVRDRDRKRMDRCTTLRGLRSRAASSACMKDY